MFCSFMKVLKYKIASVETRRSSYIAFSDYVTSKLFHMWYLARLLKMIITKGEQGSL